MDTIAPKAVAPITQMLHESICFLSARLPPLSRLGKGKDGKKQDKGKEREKPTGRDSIQKNEDAMDLWTLSEFPEQQLQSVYLLLFDLFFGEPAAAAESPLEPPVPPVSCLRFLEAVCGVAAAAEALVDLLVVLLAEAEDSSNLASNSALDTIKEGAPQS
jgi:hypothetical protein